MGTCNFHKTNASKYYVVLMPYQDTEEDEQGHERIRTIQPDDHDLEFLRDCLRERTEECAAKNKYTWYKDDFGEMITYSTFMGIDVEVGVKVTLNYGYYEGAVLDYNINLRVDGTDVDDLECATDYWLYLLEDDQKGLSIANRGRFERKLQNALDHMTTELETVFAAIAEHKLQCIGVASNGEAFYQEI